MGELGSDPQDPHKDDAVEMYDPSMPTEKWEVEMGKIPAHGPACLAHAVANSKRVEVVL